VKFLLDHDVPEDLSYLLGQLGHEVTLLRQVLPADASDETVLEYAHERPNGQRCFGCWSVLGRPASAIT